MIDLIKWFVLLEILGWMVFPITFKLFNSSADKGYSTSKIIGLLLWGYVYWLGNSFQIIENNLAGVLLSLFTLAIVSIVLLRKEFLVVLLEWCKKNYKIIVFLDSLFLITFFSWAIVRAGNPEIVGTEKPMELAFITSIFRSPSFPPSDPWLSNYAISYYYFGYLMVTMIMRICGTISGVAFNLTISAWFGLVAVASSGILFNLLFIRNHNREGSNNNKFKLLLLSLLAPLLILVVSNGEGLLEVLHSRGVFWRMDSNAQMTSSIWKWLDIKELTDPPPLPLDWIPSRAGGTWWWRASRVLQDYTFNGQSREIIDEFPFFSFLLADLHPHVLSMPFVLLVTYFGCSVFFQQNNLILKNPSFSMYLKNSQVWITSFLLGGLLFINTWDFPIYLGLFVLIHLIQSINLLGFTKLIIKPVIFYSIVLVFFSILLFIPFLIGLSSQAGGFIPSLIFRTRGIHFFIMFLPLLILITWFLIANNKEYLFKKTFNYSLFMGILTTVLLFLFSLIYASLPFLGSRAIGFLESQLNIRIGARLANLNSASGALLGIFGAENIQDLIRESIKKFINEPYVILFLVLIFALCVVGTFHTKNNNDTDTATDINEKPVQFAQIIIILGVLLCFIPEVFYLRDQFGWRTNTIFKFYFQGWIVLSLAASFSITEIWLSSKTNLSKAVTILAAITILSTGLIYPFFTLRERMNSFANFDWSLDGNNYYAKTIPLENDAIRILNSVNYGFVAEAVGSSYSNYGRVSKLSGLPSILGWPGHESQWRGGAAEIGNRESDIKDLFTTSNWDHARAILDKYKIQYIFVGILEKNTYPVSINKFDDNLESIFNNSEITIYQYTPRS